MKQLFQDLKTGKVTLEEVPTPSIKPGYILIKTTKSIVSLGTERMLLSFGQANWINKIRQQPDKVQQVIQKLKTDGWYSTLSAIKYRFDQPLPLGYCNVGEVISVGEGVISFQKGDRVISNGPHAEFVLVPENLCAKIPDTVSDTTASFTVLSAIALQSVRLLAPTLGESIVVIGLGLIGMLTCQILQANGCQVIGLDSDPEKINLAKFYNIPAFLADKNQISFEQSILSLTNNNGADGVIISATTNSNDLIKQAACICRKRGRIILLGTAGLKINRTEFYQKEISFQVSCSYGPGRYETFYEEKNFDYPIGYVRWTAQRNFIAVLKLMQEQKLIVEPLISKTISFQESQKIYVQLHEIPLGILFEYQPNQIEHTISITSEYKKIQCKTASDIQIGLIGAGNFTAQTLLPILKKEKVIKHTIMSRTGTKSNYLARKYHFYYSTTDYKKIFENSDINVIFITTRHDSHHQLVIDGLKSGKHVFVEKPLALNIKELEEITITHQKHPELQICVGFNRRFAPHILKIKSLLPSVKSHLSMIMTVNAGKIPFNHWVSDQCQSGGRIIGEACHFIDLLQFIAESLIKIVTTSQTNPEQTTIQLNFQNGATGIIHYLTNGHQSFPKERLEIFSYGQILQLNNFRELRGFGFKKFNKMKLFYQDKGHANEMSAFLNSIKEGKILIPFEELKNTTLASFAAVHNDSSKII